MAAQKDAASTTLDALDRMIADAENNLAGLRSARTVLAAAMNDEDDPVAAAPTHRKRGPNKAKRGLPHAPADEDETTRMSV